MKVEGIIKRIAIYWIDSKNTDSVGSFFPSFE